MPIENDLVEACYRGDIIRVEQIIKSNVDINCRAEYSDRPVKLSNTSPNLYIANIRKLHDTLGAWTSNASRVENLRNFTPLAAAIYGRQHQLVARLLDVYGADICREVTMHSYCSSYHWTERFEQVNMLALALIVSDQEILGLVAKHLETKNQLEYFLTKKVKMKHIGTSDYGLHAIEILLLLDSAGNMDVLDEYLIRAEYDLDEIMQSLIGTGERTLVCAKNMAKYMIQNIGLQKLVDRIIECYLLVNLVADKRLEIFNFFIGYLSDGQIKTIMQRDFTGEGNPMLCEAVWTQNIRVVKIWLDPGENLNDTGPDQNTSLQLSLMPEEKNYEIVKLLIEAGVDVNLQNKQGNTALHVALLRPSCDFEIIEQLVKHGADLNIKNQDGKTPLNLCRQPYLAAEIKRLVGQDEQEEQDMKSTYGETIDTVPEGQLAYGVEPVEQEPEQQLQVNTNCCLPWFATKSKTKEPKPVTASNNQHLTLI